MSCRCQSNTSLFGSQVPSHLDIRHEIHCRSRRSEAFTMGAQEPFMYDHPTKYSFLGPADRQFNPKTVTQASWTPRAQRPKHDGPLIESKEFNRHPDSYIIVPYGNLNAKPMGKRTKAKVKWTRLTQLFLRICALLGALGMLVCVICLRGTETLTGWVIRVPVSRRPLRWIPG